jgi:hypothetical protein
VSTILDALKRLEAERRKESAPQAPLSMTGPAASPYRVPIHRRGIVLILAGLVTIGVVAALVWVNGGLSGKALLRKGPSPDPTAKAAPPDALKKPAATALLHAKGPEESAGTAEAALPVTSRKPAARERASAQAPVSRQTVLPTYSEQFKEKSLSTASSAGGSAASAPRPERTTTVDQAVLPPPAKTKPATALREFPDAQASASPDPYAEAEPLARGTLHLQAISWSDIPTARITVIDGRILREGHSVEGYTVIEIRPEDIIVGKAGKRWKLTYRLP